MALRGLAGKLIECKKSQLRCNVILHLIAMGSSRANGQVQQVMGVMKSLLSSIQSSGKSWQESLGEVQLAINSTINRTAKVSPLELMIGKVARPAGLAADYVEEEVDFVNLRLEALRNM